MSFLNDPNHINQSSVTADYNGPAMDLKSVRHLSVTVIIGASVTLSAVKLEVLDEANDATEADNSSNWVDSGAVFTGASGTTENRQISNVNSRWARVALTFSSGDDSVRAMVSGKGP